MGTTASKPLALVYTRVSTTEQVDSGASLDAQSAALTVEAERRGYRVEVLREEGRSGKSLAGRPVLTEGLERLARGEAQALIAQRLDRISRSVADFAGLLDKSARQGWALVVVEADVDTSTPSGRFLINVLASAAQFERDLVGARTKEALAQRKRDGVRLGRPSSLPTDVVARIVTARRDGWTLAKIADDLNEAQVPTAQGGRKWYPATVRKVLAGQDAAALV